MGAEGVSKTMERFRRECGGGGSAGKNCKTQHETLDSTNQEIVICVGVYQQTLGPGHIECLCSNGCVRAKMSRFARCMRGANAILSKTSHSDKRQTCSVACIWRYISVLYGVWQNGGGAPPPKFSISGRIFGQNPEIPPKIPPKTTIFLHIVVFMPY